MALVVDTLTQQTQVTTRDYYHLGDELRLGNAITAISL